MFVNLLLISIALLGAVMLFYFQHMLRIMFIPKKIGKAKAFLGVDDEKAVMLLTSVLSIDRGNPDANWMLSKVNITRKHYIMALMFLQDMLKYNRFTPEIREQDVREALARVYLILGNIEKAIEQFNTMSRKWALPSSLLKTAVRMQIDGGFYAEAKKLIKEGMMTYPLDGEFYYMMGQISFAGKDYTSAEIKFTEAEKKGFYSENLDYYLARVYFLNKRYELTIEKLKKIAGIDEMRDKTLLMLAESYFYIKNYLSAIEVFESMEQLYPEESIEFSEMKYFHAMTLEMIGQIDPALELWSMVSESSPHYEEARERIYLYANVANDKLSRRLLICSNELFLTVSTALLSFMDFSLKKLLFQDDKSIYFFCSSKRDTRLFNDYMIVVTRTPRPLSIEELNAMLNRKKIYNIEHVAVVAPRYSEEAILFAAENDIALNNIDMFRKSGVLRNHLDFEKNFKE